MKVMGPHSERFTFLLPLAGIDVLLPYGKRIHVLVAPGMVSHDKVFLLALVIYLQVSFSRFLDFRRKVTHIWLVLHVTYFVYYCLNVYCLTQFFLNRLFDIVRPRSYTCVAWNWVHVRFPIILHFWILRHRAGRGIFHINGTSFVHASITFNWTAWEK